MVLTLPLIFNPAKDLTAAEKPEIPNPNSLVQVFIEAMLPPTPESRGAYTTRWRNEVEDELDKCLPAVLSDEQKEEVHEALMLDRVNKMFAENSMKFQIETQKLAYQLIRLRKDLKKEPTYVPESVRVEINKHIAENQKKVKKYLDSILQQDTKDLDLIALFDEMASLHRFESSIGPMTQAVFGKRKSFVLDDKETKNKFLKVRDFYEAEILRRFQNFFITAEQGTLNREDIKELTTISSLMRDMRYRNFFTKLENGISCTEPSFSQDFIRKIGAIKIQAEEKYNQLFNKNAFKDPKQIEAWIFKLNLLDSLPYARHNKNYDRYSLDYYTRKCESTGSSIQEKFADAFYGFLAAELNTDKTIQEIDKEIENVYRQVLTVSDEIKHPIDLLKGVTVGLNSIANKAFVDYGKKEFAYAVLLAMHSRRDHISPQGLRDANKELFPIVYADMTRAINEGIDYQRDKELINYIATMFLVDFSVRDNSFDTMDTKRKFMSLDRANLSFNNQFDFRGKTMKPGGPIEDLLDLVLAPSPLVLSEYSSPLAESFSKKTNRDLESGRNFVKRVTERQENAFELLGLATQHLTDIMTAARANDQGFRDHGLYNIYRYHLDLSRGDLKIEERIHNLIKNLGLSYYYQLKNGAAFYKEMNPAESLYDFGKKYGLILQALLEDKNYTAIKELNDQIMANETLNPHLSKPSSELNLIPKLTEKQKLVSGLNDSDLEFLFGLASALDIEPGKEGLYSYVRKSTLSYSPYEDPLQPYSVKDLNLAGKRGIESIIALTERNESSRKNDFYTSQFGRKPLVEANRLINK